VRDRPNGADLLAVARRSLLDDVAPALKGQPRYLALMVANAMGIALRELEEAERFEHANSAVLDHGDGGPVESAPARLVASVRKGGHDADTSLYDALKASVEVAATIWKPVPGRRSS
jgi:Domain of unknown function (DUF6285)